MTLATSADKSQLETISKQNHAYIPILHVSAERRTPTNILLSTHLFPHPWIIPRIPIISFPGHSFDVTRNRELLEIIFSQLDPHSVLPNLRKIFYSKPGNPLNFLHQFSIPLIHSSFVTSGLFPRMRSK